LGTGAKRLTVADVGEFGLIERLQRRLDQAAIRPAAGEVRRAIGDDAALLAPPPGTELVATIDGLVEEVHFRRDWSKPEDLGWKSLAVNLSDLGAMGARPLAALVSLALPPDTAVSWIDRLYQGLAECGARYGCAVAGGDTVRSPRGIAISVAALGTVPSGRAVLRSGASVGDLVCVTGVLGDSGAALALLGRGGRVPPRYRPVIEWHVRPAPPVRAGAALAETGLATAMMDLSDGLASDLRHIAKASGVGARIDARRLPISDAARLAAADLGVDPVEWALHGGEDYQLLFTVPRERFPDVPPALGPLGVAATIIGEVTRRGVTVLDGEGRPRPLRPAGFAHFG
jgi:thiamine-monophosphate kinase